MRPECLEHEADVLVERNTELFGSPDDILPAHTPGERLVLELFLHAGNFQVLQTAGGTDEGACDEEAGQLVDCEECASHRCIARDVAVAGVTENGALHGL